MKTLRRLAVVNRGEPAMRAIRAVRERNAERPDEPPLRVIALYTEPDAKAMFVRAADEAYLLGPGTFTDPDDGERKSGYLDYRALERALVETEADSAWVGWGFVAEHEAFAALCERLGVAFAGPGAEVMRRLGDKVNAKRLAEESEVPVAPWKGPVDTVNEAMAAVESIGFPLMIKAAAGGGGRGIRRVDRPEEVAPAFESARAEALKAFGDPTVLLERLVTRARHVEVQVIADGQGQAWALGVRDCSAQRRHQKVIEESASPALTADEDASARAAARRLVLNAGYRGAATVEFLYEPGARRFSFMEVNARLQVEHPVTEAVTGADLVKLQLHVAAGGRLEGDPPGARGHAVEARLNTEDPARDFSPAPGRIRLLRLPTGPGVRVDTGVAEGDEIPPEFDSMIAKVIAHGRDRPEALARLERALGETMVVVEGGTTNQGFLLGLLRRPELRAGEVDTTWLDRLGAAGELMPAGHPGAALMQAAIELADAAWAVERRRFFAFARRGRPQSDAAVERTVQLRFAGRPYRIAVARTGPRSYRLRSGDGPPVDVTIDRLGAYERRLRCGGCDHRVVASVQGGDVLVDVDGVPHRVSSDEGGLVRSPAPAVVVSLPMAEGEEVRAGDVIAVVESMKMETALTAPFAGRVRQLLAGVNVQVPAQAPLVRLDPSGEEHEEQSAGAAVRLEQECAAAEVTPVERSRQAIDRLERLVLGYDVPAGAVRELLDDLDRAESGDTAMLRREHGLLEAFADLRALTRVEHVAGEELEDRRGSPQEHLNAFLRSLDVEAEGLPDHYVALLRQALGHYGVEELDRSPALEEALFRVFLSQRRIAPARTVVAAILERRLRTVESLSGLVDRELREVLDRLVVATEHRDPVIADLAREVRDRYFDEPVMLAAREAVNADMERHLAALDEDPNRPDRTERIAALVGCPQPLAPRLTNRMGAAEPAVRAALLEVLTARYYRIRQLEGFSEVPSQEGIPLLVTDYGHEGHRHHVVTAFAEIEDLPAVARALAQHARARPADERVVVDVYAHGEAGAEPPTPERLAETFAAAGLPGNLHRIVVGVTAPERGLGMSAVDIVTLRPEDGGLREDEFLRGLHPMMGKRIQLWRFVNFELKRLPSTEDIYLFHGVGRRNPRDERLFAIAEVRDLTPARDAAGAVVGLPGLERMWDRALEGIRRFQAPRPARKRLQWNRVLLYVWPPIDFAPEELLRVAERLEPPADLGIEVVLVRGRMRDGGAWRERVLRFANPTGHGVVIRVDDPPAEPLRELDEHTKKIVSARRRGTVYPYELVRMLAPPQHHPSLDLPPGEWVEHDLDEETGRLVPVDRPPGENTASIVVGVTRSSTERYPEGITRVTLLGDPTRALGALAEPECRRINAALDLAEELGVPAEWFALSAGAKIAMDSGSENMDWIAAVLRRIIEFTQGGGELNVVVTGINVGAQPYWNAEATMLMHTKGILVMTPASAMVLTGKQALDYAGGVSADDNFGIGGYERIMGPNGQAQYWAADIATACRILMAHYDHAYVAPGERFPRRSRTADPPDRDVGPSPHYAPGSDLSTVGEIFSDETNPDRKKGFDIRSVMRAVIDSDHPPLERWAQMHDAETAVSWDAHLGGWPVALLGFESRPLSRYGLVPADGPDQWTSGTLFPMSSKKVARSVNAASGSRPLVVLANLSGFDGSPESMRSLQLEFGAEIGRAVVNFDGPIVFCVVSRYHGGAFVVFSTKLNESMETLALEGSRASVIGGSAAAAVVFTHEVDKRTDADPRIAELAEAGERARLAELRPIVRSEKLGELAAEFDAIHSVQRAVEMGSVHAIIPAAELRPRLIDAVERGMRRFEGREDGRAAARPGAAPPGTAGAEVAKPAGD